MIRFSTPLLTLLLVSLARTGHAAFRETKPCRGIDDPYVIELSQGPATDSCCLTNTCPESCCRLYTTGLIWDEDDDFPHQPCVCNSRTVDPASLGGGGGGDRADGGGNNGGAIGGGGTGTGTGGTGTGTGGTGTGTGTGGTGTGTGGSKSKSKSKKPPKSKKSAKDEDDSRADNEGNGDTPPIGGVEPEPATCANGSTWHGSDYHLKGGHKICTQASDCEGVERLGKVTCCLKAMCWCASYERMTECLE